MDATITKKNVRSSPTETEKAHAYNLAQLFVSTA